MTTYYAHSAEDELGNLLPYEHWQTLQSHSVNVGEMAAEFARVFGAQEIACPTGQLHDVGKYSEPFNYRLHGGPSVDHATAGTKIAVERWGDIIGKLMAFCIAGHHAGLANGNGEGDNRRTLKDRLALQFGADIPALDNLWQQEIKLPQNLSAPPLKPDAHHPFFSYAFFTRMLYSCLVDADYLDTETFYLNLENKAVERGGFPDFKALQNKFKQFVQNILRGSGYDEPNMLIARNAVNYAYAMYLRLLDIGENHADANSLVRRLLAISLMTGRHSGGFETQFEQDIKRIQSAGDMAKFIATLEEQELSDVFWSSTLVDEFDKPTTNNPFWHMFIAAQNKLLKQSFLSKNNIARDLATDDIHHIFPKNYLVKHGYDKSKYNRIANFVHLRNDINISVSDLAPREYLGDILSGGNNHHSDIVNEAEMINNFEDNAIPKILLQAEVDDYDEFLRQRQVLMAEMVREYYKTL